MNRGGYSDFDYEGMPEDEYGGESDFAHDALSVIGVISVNHYMIIELCIQFINQT